MSCYWTDTDVFGLGVFYEDYFNWYSRTGEAPSTNLFVYV